MEFNGVVELSGYWVQDSLKFIARTVLLRRARLRTKRPSGTYIAGCNPSLVLQPPKHDLDPVAPFVAALVVFHGGLARFSARDAGLYPFVFQRISEPISVIAAICEQPICLRQFAHQGRCARVVADLPSRHEEIDRAANRVGDSMQLRVHPAFRASDQAATLPFFCPQA